MLNHQECFHAAWQVTDFIDSPEVLAGYYVWYVTTNIKGGWEDVDGPYFTESETQLSGRPS